MPYLSPPDKRPKSPSPMAPTSDRSKDPVNQPSLLRTKSLPTSRRRRHHHRSRAHRKITAPITLTPTVTLIEVTPMEVQDHTAQPPLLSQATQIRLTSVPNQKRQIREMPKSQPFEIKDLYHHNPPDLQSEKLIPAQNTPMSVYLQFQMTLTNLKERQSQKRQFPQ